MKFLGAALGLLISAALISSHPLYNSTSDPPSDEHQDDGDHRHYQGHGGDDDDYCSGFRVTSQNRDDIVWDEYSRQEVSFDFSESDIKRVEYVDLVRYDDDKVVDAWATGPWYRDSAWTGSHELDIRHEKTGYYYFLLVAITWEGEKCKYKSGKFKIVSHDDGGHRDDDDDYYHHHDDDHSHHHNDYDGHHHDDDHSHHHDDYHSHHHQDDDHYHHYDDDDSHHDDNDSHRHENHDSDEGHHFDDSHPQEELVAPKDSVSQLTSINEPPAVGQLYSATSSSTPTPTDSNSDGLPSPTGLSLDANTTSPSPSNANVTTNDTSPLTPDDELLKLRHEWDSGANSSTVDEEWESYIHQLEEANPNSTQEIQNIDNQVENGTNKFTNPDITQSDGFKAYLSDLEAELNHLNPPIISSASSDTSTPDASTTDTSTETETETATTTPSTGSPLN